MPYPIDRSADIEEWFQSKHTKKYKLNRDYFITGKIDERLNGNNVVFFEENRNTQEKRVVYRVIQWAFHQPSAGPDSPKWQLCSLKECLQIEDALEKVLWGCDCQNKFPLSNFGVIHFNSLPQRPNHFEYYSFESNLRGLIRRAGSTNDDVSRRIRELQREADKISRIKGPTVVSPAVPPAVPTVVSTVISNPDTPKVDEMPFDQNPYDTLSGHFRQRSVVNQEEKRVAPNVPKLPKPLQSEWRRLRKQERRQRQRQKKKDSDLQFRYKMQHRRDSDIESEFQGKYEEMMGNRLQVHHDRRSRGMNANLHRLAAERKLDQHGQQLLHSVENYEMMKQRMYQKAEEDLYERQKYLQSLNYKMQGRGGRRGQRSVEQMAKSNQMMLRRLERERVDLEMTNKMNQIERELIMMDSGLANEEDIDKVMLKATRESKNRQSARKRRQSARASAQSRQKPFFDFL